VTEVFVASAKGRTVEFQVERASAPELVALVLGDSPVRDAPGALVDAFAARRATVVRADVSPALDDAELLRMIDSLLLFVRGREGMSLPVCLAAVGDAAPAVFRMVTGAEPGATVLTVDARTRGLRDVLGGVGAPCLLLFDGSRVAGRRQRLAARHISGPATVLAAEVAEFDDIVRRWVADPRRVIAANASAPAPLRKVVPAMAAVAMFAGTAAVVADPFAHGVSAQVSGPSARPSDAANTSDVKMAGDGKVKQASTGSLTLVDAQGLRYFVNTNVTFHTTSSASGAMSEASFTHAVPASTLDGGTVMSTLNDAFDGYQGLWVDISGAALPDSAPSADGNDGYYNLLGEPPTSDPACGGRQYVFPTKTYTDDAGSVDVHRTVFVPSNDQFGRYVEYLTNNGSADRTVTIGEAHNLGSDANTKIVDTSGGGTSVDTSTQWVNSFQNFSGTTSSDPRLGHVFQGAGATTGLAGLSFSDGDDNPWWGYTVTIPAGQTVAFVNYVTGQPSNAAAQAKAAELASGTNANQFACMTDAERAEVKNFAAAVTPVTPVEPVAPAAPVVIAPKFTG
jgi:hypothetical protein